MDEKENDRTYVNCCHSFFHGPKPILVQQIVGQNDVQQSIDLHIRVPRRKPAIEQVIDVFVKKVKITRVDILRDKVIVCGCFEVKVLYVACLPQQPVHVVEVGRVRFTADVCIPGAHCGMDADASVVVEYVDYECDKRSRAYWHKHEEDCCEKPCFCKKPSCTRKCDVFIVLKICAKVMTDREIICHPLIPIIPIKPKG